MEYKRSTEVSKTKKWEEDKKWILKGQRTEKYNKWKSRKWLIFKSETYQLLEEETAFF